MSCEVSIVCAVCTNFKAAFRKDFSSAGVGLIIYNQSKSICLCVCVLTTMAQSITAAHRDLWSCIGIQTSARIIPRTFSVQIYAPSRKFSPDASWASEPMGSLLVYWILKFLKVAWSSWVKYRIAPDITLQVLSPPPSTRECSPFAGHWRHWMHCVFVSYCIVVVLLWVRWGGRDGIEV